MAIHYLIFMHLRSSSRSIHAKGSVKPLSKHLVVAIAAALVTCMAVVPFTPGAADSSAETLIQAGHWKRARPLVEKLYQENPKNAEASYLLSRVKMAFGD